MTVEQKLQNMLSNTSDTYDKSLGSWTYDIEKAVANELIENEKLTDSIINKIDVENLTGNELTRFVFQRTGIRRVLATNASGEVVITAIGPTTINKGDLVAAEDLFYEFTQTVNIPSAGQYSVRVQSVNPGLVGNVPVGAINSFPTTLANISNVINEQAFENGYPEETDTSLRQRYYDKLQRPGKAGNPFHYYEWARSVPGVGKVKVFPRWNGPLNVRVAILDINNEIAPQQLIESTLNYIETQRPFGANVSVVTGEEFAVNISADFTLKAGYTFTQVEQSIKNKLTEYFKSIAFDEGLTYISQAQMGRELLDVEGIEDYSNLLLNGSTGNIPISDIQVPIIGDVVNA